MNRITVVICTFNRATALDRTLTSFQSIQIPNGIDWELLVVNNNSSDATDAVIAKHSSRLPIQRIFEATPGKSRAANRAVGAASGELTLWTDDDVIVDERWVAEYALAAQASPDTSFFGGTVDPWFEVIPPTWIERNIRILNEPFALAQHGDAIFPLSDQAVVGANMAIKTEVLRRFPFNVTLGPVGTRALRGEETELFGRFRSAGLTGLWVGSARVKHLIVAERLTSNYLWHWYSGLGSYVAYREGIKMDVPKMFGAPRWAVKKYALLRAKSALLTPMRSAAWLRTVREAALMEGYIREARRIN
jgi:glycosyltransferase involved in cell wall biosynthesis